ncbi:MAG TPA: endonuclease [Saprospiraceae bacterium]|nr:endonuclease [Saprospiraceae bacterium]
MLRLLFFAFLGALAVPKLSAQIYQPVFPNLTGDELLDSVASHYRPTVVLDYANARDTLFASVLTVEDDTLRCIYSGYALYLDPTQDPTQYVYLNGSSLGMNTEHAYPQSKGAADGNARSDMHHIFPARIPVNEARADVPYAEIPDAQTQKWFRGTQVLTGIPTQDKDAYSESRTGINFEPRESVKGDLARAVFYFYTMYRAQANAADPNFFESQRPTLCQWQQQDPADSAELIKTWRIAPYQEGKPNPFILDCTLAYRCWCPEVPTTCETMTAKSPVIDLSDLRLLPNPFSGTGQLEMTSPFDGSMEITLRSVTGQEIAGWQIGEVANGSLHLPIEISNLATGQVGLLDVRLWNGKKFAQGVLKVVGW